MTTDRRGPARVLAFCLGIVPYAAWVVRDERGARTSAGARRPASGQWWRVTPERVILDVVYALRLLRTRPGFSVAAVGIIAFGIGATTAMYTVVDRVLLRDLPYEDPHELVFFDDGSHSVPDFRDWRDRTDVFETIVAATVASYAMTGSGRPERVRAARVTPEFFSTFGARAEVGRLLGADDFTTPPQTVVLSHGMWLRSWGGDRSILGRRITVNGHPLEIVGILGPEFVVPEALTGPSADLWLPFDANAPEHHSRGTYILQVAARLRSEATMADARARLDGLAIWLAAEHPDTYRRPDGSPRPIPIRPLHEATVGDLSRTLVLLLAAVGVMLLIACANVANLLLARGLGRSREIALRVAVGASRLRVLQQLVTESIVLALVGGVIGIGLAVPALASFATLVPALPLVDHLAVDLRIATAVLGMTLVTGVVFGMLPALQAVRTEVHEMLKDGAARVTTGRGRRRVQDGLVVAEMAMALVLVTGAAVLVESLIRLQQTDPGLEANDLYVVPLALSGIPEVQRGRFTNEVLARMRALPATRAAGAGVTAPFIVTGGGRCCWFMDFSSTPDGDLEPAILTPVTPGYFRALGATILRGRAFTSQDRAIEPIPVILNAAFSRRMFAEGDPIGETLYMNGSAVTVVGIVNDVRHWGLTEPIDNDVYTPYAGIGEGSPRLYLALRSTAPPAVLVEQVREAIWAVNPNIPVDGVLSMGDRIRVSIAGPRFTTQLLVMWAALSLMLAAAGMYSSMAYSVAMRTSELGLRVALGARSSDVTRLIIRRGAVLGGAGIVVGTVAAWPLMRLFGNLIVGVHSVEASTVGGVAVLLLSVSLSACYVPARKASRANPIDSLRGGVRSVARAG